MSAPLIYHIVHKLLAQKQELVKADFQVPHIKDRLEGQVARVEYSPTFDATRFYIRDAGGDVHFCTLGESEVEKLLHLVKNEDGTYTIVNADTVKMPRYDDDGDEMDEGVALAEDDPIVIDIIQGLLDKHEKVRLQWHGHYGDAGGEIHKIEMDSTKAVKGARMVMITYFPDEHQGFSKTELVGLSIRAVENMKLEKKQGFWLFHGGSDAVS